MKGLVEAKSGRKRLAARRMKEDAKTKGSVQQAVCVARNE
jgi:hypothetical protein